MRHQLPEKEVKRLYRILHIYSLGFQQVVNEVCLHAAQRQQLLMAVWKAFSQLWQDALQVCRPVLCIQSLSAMFLLWSGPLQLLLGHDSVHD